MATEASIAAQLLDGIMTEVGEERTSHHVEFIGEDPIFPTTFRIGDAGAATIAACATAAARLWLLRSGRRQEVRVPVEAAAAAMRSSRYIRLVGAEPRVAGGRGLPIYRTADDRWFYFQRLFDHHQARVTAVLGCEYEEEALSRAIGGWISTELEEALVERGASAGYIRTWDEWAAHDQANAISRLPLLEVVKIGECDPVPMPRGPRPLSGMRVVDITRVLAGPTSSRTLAEHGADVMRVGTDRFPDNPTMMQDTGHGKRSCRLDLKTDTDARHLWRLIESTDVVCQGYRPGALDGMGFSPTEVAAKRPGIVYVSISAFGHDGPWSARRGFDSVVQAVSGIAHEAARDGVPRFLPANPLDYMTGYLAAFGAMLALHRRAISGGSYLVRVSLAQTGRWLQDTARVERDAADALPLDLAPERLDELMISRDTPFGRLRYLAPAAEMSETPPRWDLPSVPLDHDPPAWGPPAPLTTSATGGS